MSLEHKQEWHAQGLRSFWAACQPSIDLYTTAKWDELDIGSRVFDQTPDALDVDITDFDVIDTGARIAETWECLRSVLPEAAIFSDGFES